MSKELKKKVSKEKQTNAKEKILSNIYINRNKKNLTCAY